MKVLFFARRFPDIGPWRFEGIAWSPFQKEVFEKTLRLDNAVQDSFSVDVSPPVARSGQLSKSRN